LSQHGKRQVAAEVALALLEAMKSVDHPVDRFQSEDVRRTLPRRLGLNPAVNHQIRLLRAQIRQGHRLTGNEFDDFIRLVSKRQDAATVFFFTGSELAPAKVRRVRQWLPEGLRLRLVKKRIARALRKLLGRRLGGFVSGAFVFEASASPFVQVDPTGDACEIVTGFCEQALVDSMGNGWTLSKTRCETRGDPTCRWVAQPTRG